MKIDFHTHTFPEKIAEAAISKLSAASNTVPFTDGTENGLLSSMEKAGIDLSVVLPVATNPLKVTKINETSAAANEASEKILHFGCVHPLCENIEGEVRRAADLGLRGIKIHPVYQGVDICEERFLRILYTAGENDLIVVTHAGDDIGFPGEKKCSPEMVRCALDTVGDVKLVLAHMGGWHNWDTVCEYLADTGAYIDTSFSLGELYFVDDEKGTPWGEKLLSPEKFVEIVRAFGSEKVLFGTDSPWSSQAETVAQINALPLSDTEKQNIFHSNARALLKLC
ncbi:MAG: metal-dependent hydrolase [Ruminococcaceae bacterium]|nr:metal-dependent hydrolase [Oscillospiraceae bacterium]